MSSLTEVIEGYINELFEQEKSPESEKVSLRRKDVAERFGCVPSQINYVLRSRFTPERGYIVESQRGGNGYIRILKISYDMPEDRARHIDKIVGESISDADAKHLLGSLQTRGMINARERLLIEIALRLGLEHLLETPAFQEYARAIATSNYSFDRMFARSVRLESQFHILMESLEDGVIGVNEKGEFFACNRHAEEMTLVSAGLATGKRGEEVFPYIPFRECLERRQTIPARVVKVNGVNLSVEVVPVLRQKE